ncbi:MAG: FHA domain-containing protein [Planctomycetaceae bacterium]
MPLCLETLTNRQIIPLDKAVLLFGRHPDCDVVLAQSAKISRKHCCIMQVNATCVIRDLGSTNGIHVNGKRVKRVSILKAGDQLAIGDILFKVDNYTKPNNGPKSSKASSNVQVVPAPASASRRNTDMPDVVLPQHNFASPQNISQELPVALPDEQGDFFPGNQAEPAFREVLDVGVPLIDDERAESFFQSSEDSQVDVVLLEPLDDDMDLDDDSGDDDDE